MSHFPYSWSQLRERYPTVAKAILEGQQRGDISSSKEIAHMGECVRRWFLAKHCVVVETVWNNADSDFDYYAKGK